LVVSLSLGSTGSVNTRLDDQEILSLLKRPGVEVCVVLQWQADHVRNGILRRFAQGRGIARFVREDGGRKHR
jgi:hypothetical protein